MNLATILASRIARLSALLPRLPAYLQAETREALAIERERLREAKRMATTVRIAR